MRILTWNILHGGGPTRLPEIILALLRHAPDLIVLTEFRITRGSQVRAVLADHGLTHQLASHPRQQPGQPARNGILIASRLPITPSATAAPPDSLGRWLAAHLPAHDLHLLGVHVPDDTRPAAKASYWQALLALGRLRQPEKCIILGDFNTGRKYQDSDQNGPPAGRFSRASISGCEALLGSLLSLGFVDAWRRLNPDKREFSWVSSEGEARRIDTAYVSPALAPVLQTAVYSHLERELAISDHAPLLVDLALGTGPNLPAGLLSHAPAAPGLFAPSPS